MLIIIKTHTFNISLQHTHTRAQTNSGLVGTDVDSARVAVKKIQGMVVEMPLRFLEKENLDSYVPDAITT